jgi:hypothetical protein
VLPSVDALRRHLDNHAQVLRDTSPSSPAEADAVDVELTTDSQTPDASQTDGDARTSAPRRGTHDRITSTLDEALADEELRAAFLDRFGTLSSDVNPAVLTDSPRGKVIGTCLHCGDGVYETDMTFGAWDGTRWRFSGYTLPGAAKLAALRPQLCAEHAIRVKFGLLDPPIPSISSGEHR